ncbi:MAG: hypothetical protein ACE5F7_04965 [Nitrospiria bacterium]
MKLLRFTIISFLLCVAFSSDVSAKPKTKRVTLERVTHLVVNIVPDLGVHFIFPFVLDENDSTIPFTSVSTNKIFKTDRKPNRNSFVILIDQDHVPEEYRGQNLPQYFGNLFLVAGDYNITIELRITDKLEEHFTEYVFELRKLEEELLIQKVIDHRIAALEAEYQRRLEALDDLAEEKVIHKLGELAAVPPRTKNIKEEQELRLDDGVIALFVDRALHYGRFVSFVYQIENSTDKLLNVTGIQLFQVNKKEHTSGEIHAVQELPPRLMADQVFDGVLSIKGSDLNPEEYLTMRVTTNKGEIEATW